MSITFCDFVADSRQERNDLNHQKINFKRTGTTETRVAVMFHDDSADPRLRPLGGEST